jgi:thiaminase
MRSNLDELKYVVSYTNGENEMKQHSFSKYDVALDYYNEKQESWSNAKLYMRHTITTEVRIM